MARRSKIACHKFGLKIPKRVKGSETIFQLSRMEPVNVIPGGTFLDVLEKSMVV